MPPSRTRSNASGYSASGGAKSTYSSAFSEDSEDDGSEAVAPLSESSAVSSVMSLAKDEEDDLPPWASPAVSTRPSARAPAAVPARLDNLPVMAAPPASAPGIPPPPMGCSPTGTSSRSYASGAGSQELSDEYDAYDFEDPPPPPFGTTPLPPASAAPVAPPAMAPLAEPARGHSRQASLSRPAESMMTSVSGLSEHTTASLDRGTVQRQLPPGFPAGYAPPTDAPAVAPVVAQNRSQPATSSATFVSAASTISASLSSDASVVPSVPPAAAPVPMPVPVPVPVSPGSESYSIYTDEEPSMPRAAPPVATAQQATGGKNEEEGSYYSYSYSATPRDASAAAPAPRPSSGPPSPVSCCKGLFRRDGGHDDCP